MAVTCPEVNVSQLTDRRKGVIGSEASGKNGVTTSQKSSSGQETIVGQTPKKELLVVEAFGKDRFFQGKQRSNCHTNIVRQKSCGTFRAFEDNGFRMQSLINSQRSSSNDESSFGDLRVTEREEGEKHRNICGWGKSHNKECIAYEQNRLKGGRGISKRRPENYSNVDRRRFKREIPGRKIHSMLKISSKRHGRDPYKTRRFPRLRNSNRRRRHQEYVEDPNSRPVKNYFQKLGYFWVGVLWAVMFSEFCVAFSASRTVRTKYGDVAGVIVTPDNRYLDAVEVFKGVPYASPPVGSLRFMPPVTGAMWSGVKMANHFSPVCPQRLPDLRNETAALRRMPRGRLEYLKRLLPYLKNQSEDCLYLNIYAPAHADLRDSTMFPVLVYIHGESYMWGAGSLYDATVLSSYGDLVVVTVNYRLGVLGFLNSNADPHQRSPSNYGLMDQIAALHWIQENIAFFGGDPRNVTLMGHGTGAACVHFLMTSTAVPDGLLFHRAILMSGSALCPWALVREPGRYTRQVARHAGCPLDSQLLPCLRDRPLELLLSTPAEPPEFMTAFGPSVDGVIIGGRSLNDDSDDIHSMPAGLGPIHFHNFLNLNNPGFRKSMVAKMSRYDLLVGMVKLEAYFSFTADDVQYGIEADRKARIMRTFVKNTYRYHLSEILATIVNEYTDWERPVQHPINIRDETLDALSDAMVVGPLVHTADLHSATRSSSYMYVFDYQTRLGDYPQKQGCIHGEELPYVFGAPLVSSMVHFPRNYTKTEVQLSEATMDYWTNFVKTGNPNQGTEIDLPLGIRMERQKVKNIEWLTYDKIHKRYLYLDMKPKMKNHYRAHRLSFWLNLVPDLHHPGGEDVPRSHHQLDPDDHEHQGPSTGLKKHNTPSPIHPEEKEKKSPTSKNVTHDSPPPMVVVAPSSSKTSSRHPSHPDGFAAYSTALTVTITVGCSLLFLNILIFILVFYQRDRSKKKKPEHTSRGSVTSESSMKKIENGGPMATICVTSGATEFPTVETRLTPTPILRSSCKDLRLLVLQTPHESPQNCDPLEPPDMRPPLPPKTSKLTTVVSTETQPLLSASTHLISNPHGTLTRADKSDDALRV